MAEISQNRKRTVLLLNPFSDECKKPLGGENPNGSLYAETPLGITYVYTYARDNLPEYKFFLIDAMGQMVEYCNKGMKENWKLLINKIKTINPDVIGIGAYYFKGAPLFHETCYRIKKVLPDVVIVAGGNYPTDAPELALNDTSVDYIIISEGEGPFVEFITACFEKLEIAQIKGIGYRTPDGNYHVNERSLLKDISQIPIPDRKLLPMDVYGKGRNALDRIFGPDNYRFLTMTISRGCPYTCTFCTATNFWGRTIRYRDTNSVLDEMQMLKEDYGATVIGINDDNFLVDKRKASLVLEGMIKRNLKLKWIANGGSNVKALNDDDFLALAIESGYCFFNLAIESSSQKTLDKIRKPVKIEDVYSLIKKVRSKYPDMYINAFFIIGFPFETRHDILNTLQFSKDLQLDWASHYIYKPFPNTDLYYYSLENGFIQEAHIDYGELFKESHIDGDDWDRHWLFKKNYEYNLRINFLENINLLNGNYEQYLRDMEYIISIAPQHCLAYRQASIASEELGLYEKVALFSQKEERLMRVKNEFTEWYDLLSIHILPLYKDI